MVRCLAVLAVLACASAGPPPLGPTDRAICPVEGTNVTVGAANAHHVAFKNGQRLYFASAAAATAYRESPKSFWLSPFDSPLAGMDGARGLPDMRNQTLYCPSSNESMLISVHSPRVVHRHGQNIFMCCYGCITAMWRDPTGFFE